MAAEFDRDDADVKLQVLADRYDVELQDNGGGLYNGCNYDTYVRVGDGEYYASLAIRNPKSIRPPYFAITRMANGRKVIDDQVPMTAWDIAEAYFDACVQIAGLRDKARTIGLIDRHQQLWTDDPLLRR